MFGEWGTVLIQCISTVYLQEMVWLCPNVAACRVAGVEVYLPSIESMHKT